MKCPQRAFSRSRLHFCSERSFPKKTTLFIDTLTVGTVSRSIVVSERMWFLCTMLIATSSALLPNQREMKMKTYGSSFYQLGYYNNFIVNITARSLMRCALSCQNDDYCRLVNYNSQTMVCSLIDESAFVGRIVPAPSESSVIVLQLCTDPAKQEPEYLCFGSDRPAVTIQTALNSARPVRNISMTVYIARFSSTGLLYMLEHASDTMHVYELNTYTRIRSMRMFPGLNKRNFDVDFAWNYFVFTGYSTSGVKGVFVVSPSGNRTLSPTVQFHGVCLSSRYIIATHTSGNMTSVFERANGSLAFQIPSTYTGQPNGCGVIRDQLFISTNEDGLKSVNIVNRTNTTVTSWPIGTYRQGWTNMVIDSSGRTHTACASCGAWPSCLNLPVCSIISNGLDNTQLATFGNYYYTSGRASKYRYRFLGTDYGTTLVAIFEY